jgi:membrane fusion protein, multidrug efflux system
VSQVRWFAFPLAAVLLLAAFPASAQLQDQSGNGAGNGAGVPEIRAQISPRRSTMLASELAGKIDDLTVREGERFKEGQKLVGFDCAPCTLHGPSGRRYCSAVD